MMTRTTNNNRAQQHMRAPSAASSVAGTGRRYSQASVSNTNHYYNTNNNKRRNNNNSNSNTNNNNNTSNNSNNNNNNKGRLGGGMFVEQAAEPFDPHVNPWAQQPSTVRQYKVDDGHSETSSNFNDSQRPSIVQLPSPIISATSASAVLSPAPHPQQRPPSRSQQQQRQQQQQQQLQQLQQARHMHSPSSVASSMTAMGPSPTLQAEGGMASSSSVISQNNNNNSGLLTDHQYTSVVALGPATKRALDTLQAEIIALNDRIDGLRQELVERDRRKVNIPRPDDDDDAAESEDNNEIWDGWRWVVKVNNNNSDNNNNNNNNNRMTYMKIMNDETEGKERKMGKSAKSDFSLLI